jgi:hypothetical protein
MVHYNVYAGNEKTFRLPDGKELVKKLKILTGHQSEINAFAKEHPNEEMGWLRYEINEQTAMNDMYFPKPTDSKLKRLGYRIENACLDDIKKRKFNAKRITRILVKHVPPFVQVTEDRIGQLRTVGLLVNKTYPIGEWQERIKRGVGLLY